MFGKIPGDDWQKAATLRALYGFMYAHPGKKLMFMGCEFGQRREWNYDHSLDWHLLDEPLHRGLRRFVQDLNRVYASEPALHEVDFDPAGFQWIDCNDSENSVVSFIRRASDRRRLRGRRRELHAGAARRLPYRRTGRRVPTWSSSTATADVYGGSNLGNGGAVFSEPIASHGHADSLRLSLPAARVPHAQAGNPESLIPNR